MLGSFEKDLNNLLLNLLIREKSSEKFLLSFAIEPSAISTTSLACLENSFVRGLVIGAVGILCNEVETKTEKSKKLMIRNFIIH